MFESVMAQDCTDQLPLSIVVAVADNGVIGNDNKLLWRLKSDLKHFRDLTWGKPIVMGRKTFQSIGKPLPGRTTVVLTRDAAFAAEMAVIGVKTADDWETALAVAQAAGREMSASEIAIVGGAEIYALALAAATTLHLTEVHASPEGDTVFPPISRNAFVEISREDHPASGDDEHPFTFVALQRKK